jgi:hypothetical protein
VGITVWWLLFLWSLCVFEYIYVFVEEGFCVRDCKGLELCKVCIVGCLVGDKGEGRRGSLVTG